MRADFRGNTAAKDDPNPVYPQSLWGTPRSAASTADSEEMVHTWRFW